MALSPFLLDEWLDAHHGRDLIDLGSSVGPDLAVRDLLASGGDLVAELLDVVLHYTAAQGSLELRRELAAWLGVDAEEVIVTTGASEALHVFCSALANGRPGNVVVPSPAFAPMHEIPRELGFEVRPYRLDAARGFRCDLDEVAALVDGSTRALLLNSPHNPTGACLSPADLESLAALARRHGAAIVCDAVYWPLGIAGPLASAAAIEGVTIVGSLSKSLCLSGLRLGWLVERDPARRAAALRARMYYTISGTPVSELLAIVALRQRDAILERARARVAANLRMLEELVAERAEQLALVPPQGGTLAFPAFRRGAHGRAFCAALCDAGVLVAPGDCFGSPAHFRVGLGRETVERFRRGMERMGSILEAYPALAAQATS